MPQYSNLEVINGVPLQVAINLSENNLIQVGNPGGPVPFSPTLKPIITQLIANAGDFPNNSVGMKDGQTQ